MSSKLFGLEFASYVEWCHAQKSSPKGRVLVAIVTLRFRVDRMRDRQLQLVNMYSLMPASFKEGDVRQFVKRVRYVLSALRSDEIKDHDFLYSWLWDRVRQWPAIQGKIERIRESRIGSRRRTFNYLWSVIVSHLAHRHEDENYRDLQSSILGAKSGNRTKDGKADALPANKSNGSEFFYLMGVSGSVDYSASDPSYTLASLLPRISCFTS